MLCLHGCTGFSLVESGGYSLAVVCRRCCGFSYCRTQALGTRASIVVAPGLQGTGSVVAAYLLSCSTAGGIFLDQGSNPWLLYWQADSLPLPHSSVGKEFAWNSGDPSLILGSGRSPEEGIGYPLQYSWASLVAQLVKTLPAMWETWVQSPAWEDPLEKGKATHSSILAWRISQTV